MFGVSGILAVVVVGLGMGRVGKYSISPSAVHKVEGITHIISAISEAAIFFCGGIVAYGAVSAILDKASAQTFLEMCIVLIFLFFVINLVRGMVIIAGKRILMSSKGLFGRSHEGASYGMRQSELWIVFMGGLRGAVSLALASILIQERVTASSEDDDSSSTSKERKEDGLSIEEELFFYVSGIVVLTLTVNGSLIGTFYEAINVYPEVREKLIAREFALSSILEGCEAETDAQWAMKAGHDWLIRGVVYDESALNDVRELIPKVQDIHIDKYGRLHIRLPRNARRGFLPYLFSILPKSKERRVNPWSPPNVKWQEMVAERLDLANTFFAVNKNDNSLTDGSAVEAAADGVVSLDEEAAVVSQDASAADAASKLEQKAADQAFCDLVFKALARLYVDQFEAHELTEEAMVSLESARHFALELFERNMAEVIRKKGL
jgi:hypothetical protein